MDAFWAAVLLSSQRLALPAPAMAAEEPRFVQMNVDHPDYDYVPSILYDDETRTWKAWWCGLNSARSGDSIWYAESRDRLSWTQPREVLSTLTPDRQPWENQHACDPSVLKNPGAGFYDWKYAMYYMGSPLRGELGDGMIGIATSMDGVNWVRFHGNPILNCEAPNHYGCGQISAVRHKDRFVMTMVRIGPVAGGKIYSGIRILQSWDGIHFFSDQEWRLPDSYPPWAAPGLEIMYQPDSVYPYYIVFGESGQEVLFGAKTRAAP